MQILARVSVVAGILAAAGAALWLVEHRGDHEMAPEIAVPAPGDERSTATVVADDDPPAP